MPEWLVGAFFFPDHLHGFTEHERQEAFSRLASAGVNTVVTESERYREDVINDAHAEGLRFWAGISCFRSDGAGPGSVLGERPELWPVLATGDPRRTMEGYDGVIPVAGAFRDARLEAITAIVETYRIDGFLLDFARWPMHWEQELRPTWPPPLDSSFDAVTLADFRRRSDLDVPENAVDAAAWIAANAPQRWIDYKCEVVTEFVAAARRRIDAIDDRRVQVGLCQIPVSPRWVGQDPAALAAHVDVLCPMVYHSILQRPPSWVAREVAAVCDEVSEATVTPVVQIDSNGAPHGADWGAPISDEDFGGILDEVRSTTAGGVWCFTGSELLAGRRLDVLAEVLRG